MDTDLIYIRKSKTYDFFKRFFDILFSTLSIIILSFLFLIIVILIAINSPGKVIFKDKRVGRNHKEINVYKFRTMYVDAEANIEKYMSKEEIEKWKIERKIDNDKRITKIGKILRKTSLDELPQLFNIFIGNMSFVGPRPVARNELDANYTKEEQNALLSVKPGLTGYWQAYGRSNVTYENRKRQEMELAYLRKRSLFFDLKLIFITIPAVLNHKGAK